MTTDVKPVTDVGARSRQGRWRRRVLKVAAGSLAMAPAVVTAVRFATDSLGANPIAEAMNELGYWTLVLLLVVLALTPLKIVLGWKWPLSLSRVLGLCAAFMATLHFLTYLVLDQFFDLSAIADDVVKRKFITVGFLGFVLLIPLAVTSTNRMVKRLGFPRWKRLHRLTYVAAAAGVIHFIWRVKVDLLTPFVFAGILILLMAIRVFAWWRDRGLMPAR